MRQIEVVIGQTEPDNFYPKDTYNVVCHIRDDFGISVESVDRQGDPERTTQHTPIDQVVFDLVMDEYDI